MKHPPHSSLERQLTNDEVRSDNLQISDSNGRETMPRHIVIAGIAFAVALAACDQRNVEVSQPVPETGTTTALENVLMLQCDGSQEIEGKPETRRPNRQVYRVDFDRKRLSVWVAARSEWSLYEGDVSLDINPAQIAFQRKVEGEYPIQTRHIVFNRQLGTVASLLMFEFESGRKNKLFFSGTCVEIPEPDTSRVF